MRRLGTPLDPTAPVVDWPRWVVGGSASLAAAFGIGALVQRGVLVHPGRDHVYVALTLLPWLLGAAGRKTYPLFDIVLICAGVLGLVWHPTEVDFSPFLLVLLTGGMTAAAGRRWGAVAAVGATAVMVTVEFAGRFDGSVVWLVAIWVAHGAGSVYQQLLTVNNALRAAQADLAERAATGERQRIAREVHDVIAHTLAVTMLHLTGARMALQRGNATDAEEALLEAERLGRQSLADVRRTVGLLAQGPHDSTAPPEPSATDIPELVTSYAAAGVDVDFHSSGAVDTLSPATGLGLYRIVQESLANIARHAPGTRVDVTVSVVDGSAVVTVTNTPPASTPVASVDGRGLDGINERAALLGGRADAGPTPDGGWRVNAIVPA